MPGIVFIRLAKEKGLRSVAFPAISTGAFGYPKAEAAKIAAAAVRKFIAKNPEAFDEILFVLYDEESYEIYCKTVKIEGD